MTYIAKPRVHHPSLQKNAIGLTRRVFAGWRAMPRQRAGRPADSLRLIKPLQRRVALRLKWSFTTGSYRRKGFMSKKLRRVSILIAALATLLSVALVQPAAASNTVLIDGPTAAGLCSTSYPGVTGPDEYNTVVDDNLYTNMMARENLLYAAATVETLEAEHPNKYVSLVRKVDLRRSRSAWLTSPIQRYCTIPRTSETARSVPTTRRAIQSCRLDLTSFHCFAKGSAAS